MRDGTEPDGERGLARARSSSLFSLLFFLSPVLLLCTFFFLV
jgi:hypothetical protein